MDHSENDPGYSAARKPAISRAAISWAAVTPEPQYTASGNVAADSQRLEAASQFVSRQEPPGPVHVPGCRSAHGTGNVPCARIHRFDLPAVPLAGAGVQEDARLPASAPAVTASIPGMAPPRSDTSPGAASTCPASSGRSGGTPGSKAAVEQEDVHESGVPQHPPEPRRRHVAAVVVGNHNVAVADPPAPGRVLELIRRRQRVAAPRGLGRGRELGGQVHEDGARKVGIQVMVAAVGITQRPPDVQQYGALATR